MINNAGASLLITLGEAKKDADRAFLGAWKQLAESDLEYPPAPNTQTLAAADAVVEASARVSDAAEV